MGPNKAYNIDCPHCKSAHPIGIRFCPNTGKPIRESVSPKRFIVFASMIILFIISYAVYQMYFKALYDMTVVQPALLSVTIEPLEATRLGAKWKLIGAENWQNSGDEISVPSEKNFLIIFKEIQQWTTPERKTVQAGLDSPNQFITVYFPKNKKSLKVLLEDTPPDDKNLKELLD